MRRTVAVGCDLDGPVGPSSEPRFGAVVLQGSCRLGADDVAGPDVEVIRGVWFCGNPDCVLHVRVGDPGVVGSGEWAERPDGVVTSRASYGGRMLCDVCGAAAVAEE